MKNGINILYALVISLTLMACPYASKVPLDIKPTEQINKHFLSMYYNDGYLYDVKKENAKTYKIIRIKVTDRSYQKTFYGYTTTINGQVYLQTHESSKNIASSNEYYVYRLGNVELFKSIVLQPFKFKPNQTFESAAEFKKYLENHADVNSLFPEDEKYLVYDEEYYEKYLSD